MKVFSMFSGIGGFDLAMRNLGHEIIGACEIDKYARQIYAKQFPGVPIHDDATQVQAESLPQFDVLCGGFPCQAFSIAGKRKGFSDTRGSLFFEIARIAKEKQPSLLFLENVKGLFNHDNGETFRTILSSLDEVGYDVEWQLHNSKYHVPQNRERVYIIGHLRGQRTRQVFPLGNIDSKPTKKIKQPVEQKYDIICIGGTQKHAAVMKNISPCLTQAMGKGGGHVPIIREVLTPDTEFIPVVNDRNGLREVERATCLDANYFKGHDYHGARTMIYFSNTNANMKQRIQEKEASWTLGTGTDFGIKEGKRIRKLTPVECERLQGFPDGWTEGISDTQRYKCCGNAVTVPVVQWIASHFEFPKDLA